MLASDSKKAEKIKLLEFNSAPMRAFHMTWMAFFLCFFAWFGIAPLMGVVREELSLTKEQIGFCIIASVFLTVFARLGIGVLCDKFGPRLTYGYLLIFGSLPVLGITFSDSYETFLLCRLGISIIGASFVITQYHTTLMFDPKVVGTANATTAGWGNLGGGVTQLLMPIIFSGFLYLGFREGVSWRLAMAGAALLIFIFGLLYLLFTQDTPEGNFKDLKLGRWSQDKASSSISLSSFTNVARDYRVWLLFVMYGACFGIELTINNIAALYFMDKFSLSITTAGAIAAMFGMMNIFARTLGGYISDKLALSSGLRGRTLWLTVALMGEGIILCFFSQMHVLEFAIVTLIIFSLLVQMSEGATFSVVPFINKKATGTVSGIVGAGGNAGALLAGTLFTTQLDYSNVLLICGGAVMLVSLTGIVLWKSFAAATEEDSSASTQGSIAPTA